MPKSEKKSEEKPETWRGTVSLPMDLHDEVEALARTESRNFSLQVAAMLREALLTRRGS